MTVIRWQPWQEMETLRRQMEQLFDDLAPVDRGGLASNGDLPVWAPAIELKNTETEITLRAELPGIVAKDLDIQVTRDAVSISGEYRSETKTEAGRVIRSEFRYGNFRRVVPLPTEIQNDRVKAEFRDGILTLTLPKVNADRPKVVKLNLMGETPPPIVAPEATDNTTPSTEQPEPADLWATN
jgi:HSP20 family protein